MRIPRPKFLLRPNSELSESGFQVLRPLIFALEPRFMFDGAAAADASSCDAEPSVSLVVNQSEVAVESAPVDKESLDNAESVTNELQGSATDQMEEIGDPVDGEDVESPALFDQGVLQSSESIESQPVANSDTKSDTEEDSDEVEEAELSLAEEASHVAEGSKEVVFIEYDIPDYQVLVDEISTNIEVVSLDGESSGVDQIEKWASLHTDYDAIHIISHGSSGTLQLGSDLLTFDSLAGYAEELSTIGESLKENGDVLLYGCDVASGDSGVDFVARLANLTGADVAASSDDTGALERGGDWQLEVQSGAIETDIFYSDNYSYILPTGTITFTTTGTAGDDIASDGDFGSGDIAGVEIQTYATNSSNVMLSGSLKVVDYYATFLQVTWEDALSDPFHAMVVKSSDGSNFSLESINVHDWGYWDGANNVIEAFEGGASLGTVVFAGNTNESFVTLNQGDELGATFQDIDEIRIYRQGAADSSWLGINDIQIANAVPSGPTITSATYDCSTNVLSVTGTNMTAGDTINVSNLTLTGQGGATYTLTTSNVVAASGTSFSVTLNATDQLNIEGLLNKAGTNSTGGTTYNLAAADDWDADVVAGDTSDATNGVTVSNVQIPAITSSTYDGSTGVLSVTGTNLVKASGAVDDISVSALTLTGEGGSTYTLTSSNVEITDANSFSVTLNATDKTAVNQILNRSGTSSTGGTTYNLAAADDWNTVIGDTNIADTTNAVTVSNPDTPVISSATYNAVTGDLVVTGTGLLKLAGAVNDIDVTKLSLSGEGGESRTLTSANVEITNGTSFTVTLNAADQAAVEQFMNSDGTVSTGGSTYNLAAAEDWAAGAAAAVTVADLAGNGVTVSNVAVPTITSSTYNAATGVLTATGSGFLKFGGVANDIDVSLLTFTGEGGSTYTLTDSSDVDITSGTAFSVTLSATDRTAVNQILNKTGTSSTGGTSYNLAAAEDWAAGAAAAVAVADLAANSITVSNVAAPAITSATYDASSNTLVVTGTGFLKLAGASNDIDISKFTFTGEGGSIYTMTSASDVEIDSASQFTVLLGGTDLTNVEALLNNNGIISADSTSYNLAAAEDWATGADPAVNVADPAGNGITVSNWSAPTVTNASYDVATGSLVVTGTNLVNSIGINNDIVVNLLTITGEGGQTYTFTDTANVEIDSDSQFTLSLSSTDKLNVDGLLNKNGTVSGDATTYNLAAADNWVAGSPGAQNIADLTGNGVTVSNVATPTITSATYDSDSGVLVVTGTNFVNKQGADNDIDISTLTFTGGVGGQTYTLTSVSDVDVTSSTSFTATLSGSDKVSVDSLLDQIGTVSSGATTYNLAAADNWLTAADVAANISDTTAAINVTIAPKITSATYNSTTGTLVVTGTNIQANGGGADIDASNLTLTGEGGSTYTLTDTADVNRNSVTQFTLTLSGTDKAALNQIVNSDGTVSTGGTTYNLAAADDWNTAVTAGNTADTVNSVTVSNVAAPVITSATYDVSSGAMVVSGTGFLQLNGGGNDIDVSRLTLSGEGGESYTLTSGNVDITNGTSFTVTLNGADQVAAEQFLNKNGTSSTSGTTYNLAAAEDWAAGAAAAVVVADIAGNGVTVSNVVVPTITSATYNSTSGILNVTGTGLLKFGGLNNDIIANTFTFTGEGGSTYTLTDTANVDIISATGLSLTLSATDKAALNLIVNQSGTTSADGTVYNIAAGEDWAAGADPAVNVADTIGNPITATINTPPVISSNGGGSVATVFMAENSTEVTVVSATDPDVGQTVTFAIVGGADQAQFTLDPTTGQLTFLSAPDFENPGDSDGDNIYEVVVLVNDGNGGTASQTIFITITNLDDTQNTPSPNPSPLPPVSTESLNSNNGGAGNAPAVSSIETSLFTPGSAQLQTIIRDTAYMYTQFIGDNLLNDGVDGFFDASLPIFNEPLPPSDSFRVAITNRLENGGDLLVNNVPLSDYTFGSGRQIFVTIPGDAFAHSDSRAIVSLQAVQSNGLMLPDWLEFDPLTGTLRGTPPNNFQGELVIRVVARDQEGREVIQSFTITVKKQELSSVVPAKENDGQSIEGKAEDLSVPQAMLEPIIENTKTLPVAQPGKTGLTEQLRSMSFAGGMHRHASTFGSINSGQQTA